eukprot:6175047-Pleurochrysis_carterae.AAC.2
MEIQKLRKPEEYKAQSKKKAPKDRPEHVRRARRVPQKFAFKQAHRRNDCRVVTRLPPNIY